MLLLKRGDLIRVGLNFSGKFEKIEHVIKTDITDIWRVYFVNGDPVVSVDSDLRQVERINEDGTLIRR